MAKIPEATSGSGVNIEHEAPAGQYIATCVKIIDQFGVMREKFQSNERIKKDVTRFIFGVYGPNKQLFLIQTFEFTISSSKDANLMDFLTNWRGTPPEIGWDYCEMEGEGAALVVANVPSKRNPSKSYAQITSIAPVFPQMKQLVAPKNIYDKLVEEAMKASAPKPQPAPTSQPASTASAWTPAAGSSHQPALSSPPADDDIPF